MYIARSVGKAGLQPTHGQYYRHQSSAVADTGDDKGRSTSNVANNRLGRIGAFKPDLYLGLQARVSRYRQAECRYIIGYGKRRVLYHVEYRECLLIQPFK